MEDYMSKKGNINYKYLRRRKSWFRRNLSTIVIAAIALLVIVAAIVAGILIGKKINNKNNNKDNKEVNNKVETQAETKSEVNWINDEEKEDPLAIEAVTVRMNEALVKAEAQSNKYPYFIKVNRALNCVTVYSLDDNGEYTVPVTAFASSCGREGQETPLVENYKTSDRYTWRLMVDNTYAQYATRIAGTDGILFHSIPFNTQANGDLEEGQYNKLGDYASLGCVRLCVRDCKWIYDNCPSGTGVTIYDDPTTPGPLGKPESIKIPEDSQYAGWDPTDPSENNPWKDASAKIEGAKDITTTVGNSVDLKEGLTATDTCGNDITSKIITVGKYTFDQAGTYPITYKVKDAIGRTDEVTVNLIVE